ncbi:MAG: phytanoyl-CoA dioxygenase [Actinomycetota bacterium]|nr:phytanoyl-CoA dioxygenase [Actinomycetota bacterium]
MVEEVLTEEDVERFVRDGAVLLKGAFSRELADECRDLLWTATDCDEHDPSTWSRPVVRIDGRGDAPFVAAANTARLHAAFDQLAGIGRWVTLDGLGTFPVRFPVDDAPNDDGWHIESTGVNAQGEAIVDPASRERVLLLLFLFSDIGPDDAPTRLRLGSHHHAAQLLFGNGRPVGFSCAARELIPLTDQLSEAAATGEAGDVWLCHPFVLHAAQRHRGTRVRFMAQPPLTGIEPIEPTRPAADRSPVEEAVYRAMSI